MLCPRSLACGLSPRHRIEGSYSGKHQSHAQSGAGEFVDYREYASGEDLRRLDWKVLARTGRAISGAVSADRARARSKRHAIDVITVPKLSGVRVTPPDYTRRPPYVGPLLAGRAHRPAGRVEDWATSNRPLASGTLG